MVLPFRNLWKNLTCKLHCLIYNRWKLEITQSSLNRWMDKKIPQSGIWVVKVMDYWYTTTSRHILAVSNRFFFFGKKHQVCVSVSGVEIFIKIFICSISKMSILMIPMRICIVKNCYAVPHDILGNNVLRVCNPNSK